MLPGSLSIPNVLPLSHAGTDGPWLVIAAPENPVLRLDVRCLDFLELHECGLHLVADEFAMVLDIADGGQDAQRIVDTLSPYTRSAAISSSDIYTDAKNRIQALWAEADRDSVSASVRGSELIVGNAAVSARNGRLDFGDFAYMVSEVRDYARVGADLPLPNGGTMPAALALIPEAIKERTIGQDIMILSHRIAHFEASRLPP